MARPTPDPTPLGRLHEALDRARDETLEETLDETGGAAPDSRVAIFAPGRINLIGDHIDYVGGTVLPLSIDRGTHLLARPRATPGVRLHALDLGLTVDVPGGPWPEGHCARFLEGLLRLGGASSERGADLAVTGRLAGGGLSSSASFCVGAALALMELDVLPRQRGMTLARLAQRVEHEDLGVACGLMDQATIVAGAEHGALALDCATGRMDPVPLDWGRRTLLAIRSRASRRLAGGAYNRRRRELAEGLARIGHGPDAIPDLGPAGLQDIGRDDAPLRRVRHVITEQRLVREAVAAARRGDWRAFGATLTASHASLRDDYAVSCPELDVIVDTATRSPGCLGARLTGAGFGGWAIALVEEGAVDPVLDSVGRASGAALGDDEWFAVRPGGCARRIAVDPGGGRP